MSHRAAAAAHVSHGAPCVASRTTCESAAPLRLCPTTAAVWRLAPPWYQHHLGHNTYATDTNVHTRSPTAHARPACLLCVCRGARWHRRMARVAAAARGRRCGAHDRRVAAVRGSRKGRGWRAEYGSASRGTTTRNNRAGVESPTVACRRIRTAPTVARRRIEPPRPSHAVESNRPDRRRTSQNRSTDSNHPPPSPYVRLKHTVGASCSARPTRRSRPRSSRAPSCSRSTTRRTSPTRSPRSSPRCEM